MTTASLRQQIPLRANRGDLLLLLRRFLIGDAVFVLFLFWIWHVQVRFRLDPPEVGRDRAPFIQNPCPRQNLAPGEIDFIFGRLGVKVGLVLQQSCAPIGHVRQDPVTNRLTGIEQCPGQIRVITCPEQRLEFGIA